MRLRERPEKLIWKGELVPKTNSGKWSLGLLLAMFVLFLIGTYLPGILYESVPAGDTVLDDIVNRPALALSMLAAVCAGVSAFVTGLVAIIKRKERAVLIYGSALIGAAVTFFVIAMLLFPD